MEEIIIRKKRTPIRRFIETIIMGLLWVGIVFVLGSLSLFLLQITSTNLNAIYHLLGMTTAQLQTCLNAFICFLSLIIVISFFIQNFHGMEADHNQ